MEVLRENLLQCHFDTTNLTRYPATEPGIPRRKPGDKAPEV
jgi:hypothetical protein